MPGSAKKLKLFGEDIPLTDAELGMTVEEWIFYHADQAAQFMRAECERQINELDAQGKQAMDRIDGIRVY